MPDRTRLTRRGRAVGALVVVVLLVALRYGTQSLNAVVLPGVLVLVGALWQIRRAEAPEVHRRLPERDGPGTEGLVEVSLDGDSRVLGVATDEVDSEGLSSTANDDRAVYGDGGFAYRLRYEARGVHEVGPTTFEIEDLLGLVRRRVRYDNPAPVVVYPPVRPLPPQVRAAIGAFEGGADPRHREQFDRIREYERGDSLRDVHWKSSAKRPDEDLVVKDFAGAGDEATEGAVLIAASAEDDAGADSAAAAAASVACHLMETGVEVGLVTPTRRHDPGIGVGHEARILDALARLEAGTLTSGPRHEADVVVTGTADSTQIRVEDRSVPFSPDAAPQQTEVSP